MGEKVGFTNCVFEKLCFFSENTIFIVFSASPAFKNQNCMMKNRKFMKNSGLFWTWQKDVFWGLFFEVLMLLWFIFVCVWHSSKSVTNACFPKFFGLFWGGFLLFICVWKVWVFLCFLFLVLFLVLVLFLFVCFVLFCGWMLLFLFLFFLFVFGPPHLALNPPYFLVFVFCLLF